MYIMCTHTHIYIYIHTHTYDKHSYCDYDGRTVMLVLTEFAWFP